MCRQSTRTFTQAAGSWLSSPLPSSSRSPAGHSLTVHLFVNVMVMVIDILWSRTWYGSRKIWRLFEISGWWTSSYLRALRCFHPPTIISTTNVIIIFMNIMFVTIRWYSASPWPSCFEPARNSSTTIWRAFSPIFRFSSDSSLSAIWSFGW